MKPGSIVEYIGGQDKLGRQIYNGLRKNKPYIVEIIGCTPTISPSLMLYGIPFSFRVDMFREIDVVKEITSLKEETEEEVLEKDEILL
jgi:hypothetical protein